MEIGIFNTVFEIEAAIVATIPIQVGSLLLETASDVILLETGVADEMLREDG